MLLGIKEVVTLTSDLSRKNLEKDFERMDTPQGTFYRVYFDIYLTLDGSEFNAELVCQGEVMGRYVAPNPYTQWWIGTDSMIAGVWPSLDKTPRLVFGCLRRRTMRQRFEGRKRLGRCIMMDMG
jgi:hypothetical protein